MTKFLCLSVAVLILCFPHAVDSSEDSVRSSDETASVSVDFSRTTGTVKAVNGTNMWGKFCVASIHDQQSLMESARFSTVRLHDIPWDNAGLRLVDTQHIFGNFKADAKNPDNYYFTATDDYIRKIVDGGAKVIYRLGPSIEHTQKHYFALDPEDHEQFAEICAAIVRHYNEGWANGFHWNIQYWEIWNEPNIRPMYDKDFTAYCELYVTVAKRLRAEFPNIKIGGPALTGAIDGLIRQFAQTCKTNNAPMDFCSWHCYAARPEDLLNPPQKVRNILDEYGFTNTELHLNEWHYFPCTWGEIHGTNGGPERKKYWRDAPEGMNGFDAAGFVGYVLAKWQDTPLDMSNYYSTGLDNWGLIDGDGFVRKPFYALAGFGELAVEAPNRVPVEIGKSVPKYTAVIAGRDQENTIRRIYIAAWKADLPVLEIALKGVPAAGTATIKRIDAENRYTEQQIKWNGSVLKIENQPGSFVLLIAL